MKHQFKTNINCSSCVAKVTPFMEANDDIRNWEVDTQDPQKILTVETDNLTGEMVKEIVKIAGYKAEALSE